MAGGIRANLLLLASSLLVAGLIGEAALRWRVGPPVVFRFPQEHYEPDPEIGHRLTPGQRAFTHQQSVSVNAHGVRGDEHPRRVGEGSRRVLAVGDSQTFGNGLALADTWPTQLERELRELEPGFGWEVLNAGVPGTDTWQHDRMLRRLMRVYDVDVVVLALYVNDVTPRPQPVRPTASRTNTAAKRLAYLAKRSALVTAVWQARALFASDAQKRAAGRESHILTGEPDRSVEKGWAQVERSLTAMQVLASRQGAGLLLAILPRRDQVAGGVPEAAFNQRATAIAASHGIPVVDLLPPLLEAWSRHGARLFIPWDGHNTELANAAVADALVGPVAELSRTEVAPPRRP